MSKVLLSAGEPGASRCSDGAAGSTAEADRFAYIPGRTLGRSGYATDPEDELGAKIGYLDALLCLVTANSDTSAMQDAGPVLDFQRLNHSIQAEILYLAAALAYEAHELHKQVFLQNMRGHQALRAVPQGGAA